MAATKPVDWSELDAVEEIYDKAREFKYLTTKVVKDAIIGCTSMDDFIWSLERQFDNVTDELSDFKRLVEKIRKIKEVI